MRQSTLSVILIISIVLFSSTRTFSEIDTSKSEEEDKSKPVESNLEGPRFGVTLLSDETKDHVGDNHLELVISQFGWQLEYAVTPSTGGSSFVLEGIILIGGVEQGFFLPSATGIVGLRFEDGWELGLGPNLSVTGSAITLAIGKTFDYKGIKIPLNFALTAGPGGEQYSMISGFALRRTKK